MFVFSSLLNRMATKRRFPLASRPTSSSGFVEARNQEATKLQFAKSNMEKGRRLWNCEGWVHSKGFNGLPTKLNVEVHILTHGA